MIPATEVELESAELVIEVLKSDVESVLRDLEELLRDERLVDSLEAELPRSEDEI